MELDKLKKAVFTRVNALASCSVYGQQAPENASYPYIVIKYPSSSSEVMWKQDWIVELDFWDDSSNSSTITGISHTVKTGLNGYWYSGTGLAFRTFLDFEGEFPCELPNMVRLNQRYTCPAF